MESSVFQPNPFKFPFYTVLREKISVDLFPLFLLFIDQYTKEMEGEK